MSVAAYYATNFAIAALVWAVVLSGVVLAVWGIFAIVGSKH